MCDYCFRWTLISFIDVKRIESEQFLRKTARFGLPGLLRGWLHCPPLIGLTSSLLSCYLLLTPPTSSATATLQGIGSSLCLFSHNYARSFSNLFRFFSRESVSPFLSSSLAPTIGYVHRGTSKDQQSLQVDYPSQ